jgi:large repetitive protein
MASVSGDSRPAGQEAIVINERTGSTKLSLRRTSRFGIRAALGAACLVSFAVLVVACGGDDEGEFVSGPFVVPGVDSGVLGDAQQAGEGAAGAAGAGGTDSGAAGEGGSDSGAAGEGGSDSGAAGTGGSDSGAVGEGGSDSGAAGTGGSDSGAAGTGGQAGADLDAGADAQDDVSVPPTDSGADVLVPGDAAGPSLAINNVSITEGNSGTAQATFTVSLSSSMPGAVTVSYTTADGTATASADHTTMAGTLTFATGETTKTISVPVIGDVLDEADETFSVVLSNPTGAVLTVAQGTGTIVDNDDPPAIAINDLAVGEGNSGTTAAAFTVSLSAPSGRSVSVSYATADGTATVAANDYSASAGTLTFAAGETSKTVTVPIVGDALDEANETFTVGLSGAVNATIGDATGAGTITDDDPLPSLSVNSVSVPEGNSGTTAMAFTVALSAPSGRSVSVNYATADGTATAGADYTAASGTLTFAPGETSKTVTVSATGDAAGEGDDTFYVVLSGPTLASMAISTGTGTILNDDTAGPSLSIADASVTESNAGTSTATLTVTLSAVAASTVTVDWATADGTAIAGVDYTAGSGTLTFAPGETTKTISIVSTGDVLDEADETILVNLAGATNAAVSDPQAVCTIADNDAQPALSVNDIGVSEGAAGTTLAAFTVALSAPSGRTVTVSYATADGTATATGSAAGENDYAAAAGQLTFAPGTTSQLVVISVNGDTYSEGNETFTLNLSGATNASIGDAQGQCTIANDDAQPSLTISDVTIIEGDTGTSDAVFTVTLSAASGRTVTINYATAAGTATTPSDFAATSGMLSFSPGQTTRTIAVPIIGDVADEANETFTVSLSSPMNATVADNQGVGSILNDDSAVPSLNVNDISVTEGNSGTVQAVFTVVLGGVATQTITVDYATADATATAGSDYLATSGTLSFAPGDTSKTVSVTVNGDTLNEANETFFLNLSNASPGAGIGDGQGLGTINNDETRPTLAIDDVTVTEGDAATTNAVLTVSLSAASGQTVTVNYASVDGTATTSGSAATGGRDYVGASGTLTFAPGETTKTISMAVNGDVLNENDETFEVRLSGAVNATIADQIGTATISNDDAVPTISIADVVVTEGNMMMKQVQFSVVLSAVSGRDVTLDWATANNTATAPSDYQSSSGSLTFAAGDTVQTFRVGVSGDRTVEPDETFFVNLANLVNATFAENQAQCTIQNDD